ncbi:outer membrane beta-barrel protein [Paraglaciecola sp. L3A3]|uniref:outer membrane beta-barrel protein n=1 Tax=Paraglaciecola sp. L3A3 TaxID=2686358 RepID=UPI00131ACEBA|nr:outer membrane beta-barrel protein [Paraglaciecola sp. L3A3]
MKKTLLATAVLSCILANTANGQEAGFSAEVDSRLTYDDNILRTSDSNAESDTSLVIAPELSLGAILGKQRFEVTYNGEYANYFDNSDVSYTDHEIKVGAKFDHSYRLTSGFDVQYKDKHEDFGDLNTIFDGLIEFNRYTEKQINGQLGYGRQESFGQLILKLGHTNRDYDNNDQEYRSNDRDLASLAFYYRIAPRTRLLAEVVYRDYTYNSDFGAINRDSESLRYQVGVEWDLTNKLEGTIKVGYQERDYELNTLRDIEGLSYEADLEWKPNTYTEIGLVAKRESIDSSLEGAGGFLRTNYGVDFKHGLTELTKLTGGISYSKDELVFGGNREDTRHLAELGVTHSLFYWVELGANLSYEDRKSTVELAEYKVNSINLTAKVSFD